MLLNAVMLNDFNPVWVSLSQRAGRWTREASIRLGDCRLGHQMKASICCDVYSHKRNNVCLIVCLFVSADGLPFIQSNVLAQSKTNSHLLANSPLSHSIALIAGDIYLFYGSFNGNCCLIKSAWPPDGNGVLPSDKHVFPLCWSSSAGKLPQSMQKKCSRQDKHGLLSSCGSHLCLFQSHTHLLSYVDVEHN